MWHDFDGFKDGDSDDITGLTDGASVVCLGDGDSEGITGLTDGAAVVCLGGLLGSSLPLLGDLFLPKPKKAPPRRAKRELGCRWCDKELDGGILAWDGSRFGRKMLLISSSGGIS